MNKTKSYGQNYSTNMMLTSLDKLL